MYTPRQLGHRLLCLSLLVALTGHLLHGRQRASARPLHYSKSPGVESAPKRKNGQSRSNGVTLTVHATVEGTTTTYIGATEAAAFWIEDLTDLGINTYRLWTKMAELEWWDDDDAVDGQWDDSEYGTPTVAEIRADVASGFANTIPWTWWDVRFDEVQSWRYGAQTRRGIIEALVQNGITPVIVLRLYDNQGQPEMRPAAQWAPRPPVDDAFRNEWWEHCFAIAYWLNVRNGYGITHFEILNEPDYNCQGWCNNSCPGFAASFCGSQAEYAQLVVDAYDAIAYANSFAGLPVHVHAPVVASYGSSYVAYTLDNADSAIQVVDYHTYAADVRPSITSLRSTIIGHNPDGILEPIWNSEWGALWSSYDTVDRAMLTANQLFTFAEEEVEGVTVFNMYDWSTAGGQDYGLIDLQDDGMGGANRIPTETYYAYRLLLRGMVGGKERLAYTASGLDPNTRVMVTRGDRSIYVLVLQNDVGASTSVTLDLSELGVHGGTATVYEYSAGYKDEVVASPSIVSGQMAFTAPANGVSLLTTLRPTAVDLASFAAIPSPAGIELTWETATELDIVGFNVYRADAQGTGPIRVNEDLIEAQTPGGVMGATYRYLDAGVVPDSSYAYWLEIVDVFGGSDLHGPVAATQPFYVCLPLVWR
jgi:hypothetical protein